MLRIERVRADLISIDRANIVVVRVDTSEGVTGVGETVVKRHDATVRQHVLEIGEILIGRDARAIEDIAEKLYRDSFWVGGPLHAAARSAIDIALWDIKGKALGAPIYELIGGRSRDSIMSYCHCPAGATPQDFGARLRELKARGFRAAKTTLPLFYGRTGSDGAADYSGIRGVIEGTLKETEYLPTATIDAIAEYFAVGREAVGADFELMLDCHGRLSPANAIRLARALEPFKLFFFEEPIPPESAEDLARVRAASPIPIAAGERLSSIYEVRPFLRAGAVDYLQCDLVTCGGITGARKIAALAEAHYVPFAPHNPNGPIATAASAHVLTAIPNASLLETVGSAADNARYAAIVDRPLVAVGGEIAVDEEPGLGLRFLESAVAAFPGTSSRGLR